MTGAADADLLRHALSGKPEVLPALVERWTPVIQARVVKLLRRRVGAGDDRAFQEVEDLVQQVFVSLFERKAASLRAWQPERGLSLDNWVGLIAEQQVLALLRTRKRNPWSEDPVVIEELDRPSAEPNPEHETLDRDALDRLLDRMQEQLSPLGWQIFQLLYLEEVAVDAAAERCGMTTAAVYAWKSRLRKTARQLREVLMSEKADPSHRPEHGSRSEVNRA